MNILIYVPQMAAYGGMERHVCTLAGRAAQRGHRVRLLTTSNSLNDTERTSLIGAGVDFREFDRPRESVSAPAKLIWLWRETFRARDVHWDIVYTNGQSALASIVWRAARPKTRIIHHHHTAADEGEQKTWSPRFRKVLGRAPELVACSEATRNNIILAVDRTSGRSTVFLPYFTASPVGRVEVADRVYGPTVRLNFGFVGRLVSTKGIDVLCDLSIRPELADITWHIHGSGPEYTADFFARYPTIQYHGPYRNLAHYGQILQGLDAIALFSQHNEGMPLSLLEAMCAGLPWVATDRGGTRELSYRSPDNTVLVESSALAATIKLRDRIRNNTTSRGKQRAVYDAHYSPEVVERMWFGFFENEGSSDVSHAQQSRRRGLSYPIET